jgi:hypothetical protein
VAQALVRVSGANKPAYNKGSGAGVDHQLAQVAMLIAADLPSQTYLVTTSGYDTHGSQSWTHGDLLSQLDTGLSWFFSIIDGSPRAKDVFVMITSEFGRQVTQNTSGGVDHGQGGGMIVLGGGVKGGLYGLAPTLNPGGPTRPNRINDALVPTVDFRDVYATALNRLGGDVNLTSQVLNGSFNDLGIFSGAAPPSSTTTTAPPSTTTSSTTSTTMPMATTTTTMPMATTTTTMAPPSSNGVVTSLKVGGVVLDPTKTTFSIPLRGRTSLGVTAVLAVSTDLLYVGNNPAKSGVESAMYMGGGPNSIIVYRNWKEVAHYTVVGT